MLLFCPTLGKAIEAVKPVRPSRRHGRGRKRYTHPRLASWSPAPARHKILQDLGDCISGSGSPLLIEENKQTEKVKRETGKRNAVHGHASQSERFASRETAWIRHAGEAEGFLHQRQDAPEPGELLRRKSGVARDRRAWSDGALKLGRFCFAL